jgi:hypothetical protein
LSTSEPVEGDGSLSRIVVGAFIHGGYLLLTFIPSLALLWLVYKSHESETRGFKLV